MAMIKRFEEPVRSADALADEISDGLASCKGKPFVVFSNGRRFGPIIRAYVEGWGINTPPQHVVVVLDENDDEHEAVFWRQVYVIWQ